MPYGGTTPAQDKKIEQCVAENTARGMDKSLAIRICKASVLGTTKHRKKGQSRRWPKSSYK